MKRFDTFGGYMFDLLFAPLKKGRQAANQFAVFFRVLGREFDDLKAMIFRVRAEADVASASELMLPVHGQDRDMPRLAGEDAEAYRTRLSMKGIIANRAGTVQGITYAMAALGYEHCEVEPCCLRDPERWAEFIVHLGLGNANALQNPYLIFSEIQKVKEASSRLAHIVFSMDTSPAGLNIAAHAELNAALEVWPQVVNELESTAAAAGSALMEYHAVLELWPAETEKEESE